MAHWPAGWEKAAMAKASEYLNTGMDCLNDSLWFEAGESLDSAMGQLSLLDSLDTLDVATRIASKALKDTVQALMLRVAAVSGEVEEINPISDLIDEDVGEAGDSASHAFDSLSGTLNYALYDLPLPRPLPPRVQKALAYFNGPARKVMARWLNRKSRYDAFVRERLEARGMPRDLFYLAMVESGLNPRAYSHAAASGMWQFIPGTGRRYGLHDDYWIDPRRDVLAATDAALSYLQTLFNEFGDWQMAMAGYNCGENRIRRELKRDSSLTYWDMKLPAETQFYVPKILAAMIIGHEPERFGFTIDDPHAPLAFDTMTVTDCLPLRDIAKSLSVTEEEIQDLNPSLRRWCTPPNRKAHILYLPAGSRDTFAAAYARMDKSKLLAWKQHRVVKGENLGGIASRYGISLAALKSANRLKSNRLHIGQNLIIPVPSSGGTGEIEAEALRQAERMPKKHLEVTYRARRGDNLYDISRRFGLTVDKLRAMNGMGKRDKLLAGQVLRVGKAAPDKPLPAPRSRDESIEVPAGKPKYHVVQKGETVFGLAKSFGVTQADLMRWNMLEGRALKAGERIVHYGEAQDLKSPNASQSKDSASEQRVVSSEPAQYYTVKSGDTLWDISQRFQSSVEKLRDLNGATASALRPGTRLRVR
jgi:membrane-bound lytic murein transglycosylase D